MENELAIPYDFWLKYLLITAVITISIWLLIRPIVLWYYKIVKATDLLETQVDLLREIAKNTRIKETQSQPLPESENNESYSAIISERKHKVKDGQALIIHKKTNNVRIVSAEEFDGLEDKEEYKIIYEK